MKQMPFILLLLGVVSLLAVNHEYQQIKARLATTQAKIDNLTDETNATVEILGAAIQDLRDVFSKLSSEAKPSLPSYKPTQEVTPEVPEQADLPRSKPTIIMHSGASCGPCNDWKAKQMPAWIKQGWDVQVITEVESNRMWPWFEVQDSDGTAFEVSGALTNDTFRAAKGNAK
jgi:hypothetical protein